MRKTMKIKVLKRSVVPLSLCATSVALGQTTTSTPVLAPDDAAIPPLALEPKEQHLNRISLSFQLGFDIKTSFKHIGRFPAATDPGPAQSLTNHVYDDGYNLVDSASNEHPNGSGGNTEGTWDWGFGPGATIDNNNGTISMHSLSSPGGSSNDRSDDPPPGFMVTFGRQLFQDSRDRWRAGLETAFSFTDYAVKDNRNVNAAGNELTDTYSLMGIVPPNSPSYSQGSTGGPNRIIIGDTPSRSITAVTSAAAISGERDFAANLFAFRLGPYVEFPLNQTFSFSLEGGAAMVYVWSNFRFNEEVTTAGGELLNVKGNSKNEGVVFGGYLGARISAALNDQWSLFAGAQWQDVSDYVHRDKATGESAVMDLSQSVFFTSGISYSF